MLTDYSKIAINPRFCGCRCEKTTKIRVPGMQSISPSNVRKVSIRPRASSLIEQPSIVHAQLYHQQAPRFSEVRLRPDSERALHF
jgi:hypothetical protein